MTANSARNVVSRRKVVLLANTAWYLHNFRGGLIRELVESGHGVTVICPHDEYVASMERAGARWREWQVDRAGINPLRDLMSIRRLAKLYRDEAPEVVHHFTIKAILHGSVAARLARVPIIVNSVTGLGHVFLSNRWAVRAVRPWIRRWYAWALTAKGVQPIFQNSDDLQELSKRCPALAERAVMSRGSGVDLKRFHSSPSRRVPALVGANSTSGAPLGEDASAIEPSPRAMFAGRLLREKGIIEFLEAGRICRQRGIPARLIVCGKPDPGNPSSIDEACLDRWKAEGFVDFLGHTDEIEDQIGVSDMVVLPSYREGTPRILLEASAMGKPIVATDVPGCREVVTHGENGFLVPPGDAAALAEAMITLWKDERLRTAMGEAGRRRVVEKFDERQVIEQTLGVYRKGRESQPGRGLKARLDRGVMLISLDLELAWGTRGRPSARKIGPFLDGTRHAVHGLLQLMEKYDIPATWAIVGALLLGRQPSGRRHPWLDDERFADIPPSDAAHAHHWYASDIVESLMNHPAGQEIGCHTLTHLYVDPQPAGRQAFQEELRRFRELFDMQGLRQPTTFIFPKAKMGHFDVLAEEGFRSYRGPEPKWFESLPTVILPAAMRLIDGKLAVAPNVALPERTDEGLWRLPSSQFYSPFMSVGKHVSVGARVRKAIKGLRLAAKTKTVYHLWTHPFNLGMRTEELLGGLDAIMAEAARLRERGELDVLTMGDLSQQLDSIHGPVRKA